jgi:hypothetical protein
LTLSLGCPTPCIRFKCCVTAERTDATWVYVLFSIRLMAAPGVLCRFVPDCLVAAPRDFWVYLKNDLLAVAPKVAPSLISVSAFLRLFGEICSYFFRAAPTTDWKIFLGTCMVRLRFCFLC